MGGICNTASCEKISRFIFHLLQKILYLLPSVLFKPEGGTYILILNRTSMYIKDLRIDVFTPLTVFHYSEDLNLF
jgi:hypothetical protein